MFSPDLQKGLFLASHELYPLDDPDANANAFLQRWGESNLHDVLQADEMSKHDKTLILYALGYLADSDATALLLSFLPSQERSVRWISALSLGRQKQEVVFELLQEMLLEEVLDFNFYLTENDLPLDDKDWIYDKDWYIERCREIVFILGDWGKVVVAPLLRKAFVLCLEHESQCSGRFSRHISLWWRPLQKSLAYALGQLVVWGAFSATQLSVPEWNRAILYLILGSLHSSSEPGEFDPRQNWVQDQPIVKRHDGTLMATYIELERIKQVILERFGFSEEEQLAYFQQIWETDPKKEFKMTSKNWAG